MRKRPIVALLASLAVTLSGSLASMTTAGANEGSVETQPRVLPAAAPVVAGTPLEILNETPVTEGLVSGFESGMFIPKGSFNQKDAKGCLYKKQLFIAMAVKKPSIGPGCTLLGGEWLADFGTKRIKNAKDIDLGQLLPDKFVYAQGARNWTEQQRRQYGQWDGSGVVTPRMTMNGLIETSNLQIVTNKSAKFLQILNNTIDQGVIKDQDLFEAQLQALRQQNPGLFDSWSVATLLNVKQWGLSFNPGTAADFQVSIRECSNKTTTIINGTNIILKNPGKMARPVSQIQSMPNPCSNTYSVPNMAAKFGITPVPVTASASPGTDNKVLSGYGTPQGPAISRFLFGIHAPAHWTSDRASGYDGPIEESSIPSIPVGSTRLWDTETAWADIEPTKGQFVYSKLQKQIEMAQRLDARPMLVLGGTPAWAGSGGRNAVPNSVEDYKNYVRAVACHFGGSIFAYEVWNEANIKDFWAGNAAQMADLTQAAFEAIRGCNPGALVVAASTTTRATGSFSTFYPEYLDELKKRNWPVDAYSVHTYPAASGGADARILGIGQFKTMLALAGAPKTTIFDTETNYGLAGLGEGRIAYTGQDAQTLISRTYIDSARYGFDSTYWFVWTRGEDTKYGIQMNPNAGSEHQAWRNTYDWLVGAQFQRCFDTSEGITVCQFNRGGDNFSIVWRGDIGTAAKNTPAGFLTGLGSRVCRLDSFCVDLSAGASVSVSSWPLRIDGTPLSSGPSLPADLPSAPAPASKPIIVSLDVTYGQSNKADVTALWQPPLNAKEAGLLGYLYDFAYCANGGTCKSFASGSTNKTSVSVDLPKGPGKYKFRVMASTVGMSSENAEQDFVMLRSDAAPLSHTRLLVRDGTGQITWDAPNVRAGLIKGYEVQVLNQEQGKWVTLTTAAKSSPVTFDGTDVPLAVGQTLTARVRTVLTTGAKSVFVASAPLVVADLLTPPVRSVTQIEDKSALVIVYSTDAGRTADKFPGTAYQLRYSTDKVTWQFAQFERTVSADTPPVSNSSLIPYNKVAIVIPASGTNVFPPETRFQVRAVDNSGLLPSEWVDVATQL